MSIFIHLPTDKETLIEHCLIFMLDMKAVLIYTGPYKPVKILRDIIGQLL